MTKNYILGIGSGLAVIGLVVLALVLSQGAPVTTLPRQEDTIKKRDIRKSKDALLVSSGWSVNPSVTQATEEALAMVQKGLSKPNFLLVFFTGPYKPRVIRDVLRKKLGSVSILGMQSGSGVFTEAGLHTSPTGSLAILGFQGKGLKVGVAGAPADEKSNHRAIAKKVILEAIKNAGVKKGVRPTGILAGQVMGFAEIYSGVLNELLPSTPMVGGNQISTKIKLGALIANDKVYDSGFVVGLFYSPRRIGTYFHAGFTGRTHSGIVTKISPKNPHVIMEIDNRPALEVYNEWTKGAYKRYLGKKKPVIVNESVVKPLAKGIKLPDGSFHYITLHPWKFNPDRSVHGGVAVSVGERVHYAEGNDRILIKRSGFVARKAVFEGGFALKKLAGGVHIYCVGTGLKLGIGGKGLASHMVREIKLNTRGAPFIGGFFGGEQGRVKGHGYFAGNLMSAMMVFSK